MLTSVPLSGWVDSCLFYLSKSSLISAVSLPVSQFLIALLAIFVRQKKSAFWARAKARKARFFVKWRPEGARPSVELVHDINQDPIETFIEIGDDVRMLVGEFIGFSGVITNPKQFTDSAVATNQFPFSMKNTDAVSGHHQL